MIFSDKQLLLLQSADEVISIKGYASTTLRDIVNNAGVNVALISYYFGSKEKMMNALVHHRCSMLRTHIAQFYSTIQHAIPAMQLRALIRQSIRHLARILKLRKEVQTEFSNNILIHDSLLPFLDLLTQYFDEVIKKGIAHGTFSFYQKAEEITAMLVGEVFFIFDHQNYFQKYLQEYEGDEYFFQAENRIMISISFSIFASLGIRVTDEKE